jgi:hypothetical protein
MMEPSSANTLARSLRGFFSEYVPELRGLSRHTLLSYRDTLILLLRFVATSRNTNPVTLELDAISPEAVVSFLIPSPERFESEASPFVSRPKRCWPPDSKCDSLGSSDSERGPRWSNATRTR